MVKLEDMIPFEQILEEHLQDPEFRAEWKRLAPARAVANRLIAYRADHGLTQTGLARRLGMSQPAVFRLELGEHLPTLQTLRKLSEVLGLEILISMAPSDQPPGEHAVELPAARVTERVVTPRGASMTIAIR